MKRIVPLVETGLVLALFVVLRESLRGTPFASWQVTTFGGTPVPSALLLFVLPMAVLIVGRRNPSTSRPD